MAAKTSVKAKLDKLYPPPKRPLKRKTPYVTAYGGSRTGGISCSVCMALKCYCPERLDNGDWDWSYPSEYNKQDIYRETWTPLEMARTNPELAWVFDGTRTIKVDRSSWAAKSVDSLRNPW